MKNATKRGLVCVLSLIMALTLFAFPVLAEPADIAEPVTETQEDISDTSVIDDADLPEELPAGAPQDLAADDAGTDVLAEATVPEPTDPEEQAADELLTEEETISLQATGVSQGTTVSGSFSAVSGMDIATVRYYLNAEKTDYGFAAVTYNDATQKYNYSFSAPYDGFQAAEASSLKPDEKATIIAQYYSLTRWDGAVDVSWYNETDTDFYLYTPAELAGFAAVVNGSVDGGIADYQVKGDRSAPADRSVNRGLPDAIESTYYKTADLIAGVRDEAWKGVMKHDFADRTVHIMSDMDMGGVPGNMIDHSLNINKDVYKAKNAYDYPNWTPIGGEYLMDCADSSTMIIAFFNGTIEGHGHYINNLYCYRWAYASVGETAYGYSQGVGLVGDMGTLYDDDRGKEQNPKAMPAIRNLGLSGYIFGRRMVGGFVGCVGGGANAADGTTVTGGIKLENLVNHADVYGTDSKGIAGIVACSMSKGSVINCYNTGNLDTTYGYPTGGIIGSNEEMNVFCCYNTGSITSSTKAGRGIGSNNSGNNYTVEDCYYLEGCGDDLDYPGYYTYNLAPSISVHVTSMTEQQMKDGTLLQALNVNGLAYVAGDNGYPVLYWEKAGGNGTVSVSQPAEGGAVTALKTGILENGTVVYLTNEAVTGWKFRYYTLNGRAVSGNYITVNGDTAVSAYFEPVKPGALKIAPNEICNITVTKNGVIFDEQNQAVEVKNYPVADGDPLYEGDLLIINASVKEGKVPEDESLQYSATAGLAVPFSYEFSYTGKEATSTTVQTYTVTEEINEADVLLTLNVVPLTTPKLWRYVGDTSWYQESASEFTLTTANELAGLAALVYDGNSFAGKTVRLGNDISLANNDGTGGTRYWDGIGTEKNPFAGTFDGQNHKITDYQGCLRGLFAYVYGSESNRAAVKNLTVYGTSRAVEASGIASRAKYADFSDCISYCNVKEGTGWSGGILGYAQGSVTISRCLNYGNVNAIAKVGGIIGELSADSSVKDCINRGDIYCLNTGGNSVGGIAGSLNGTLKACANYGNLEAWGRSVGGIAGQSVSQKAEIRQCYQVGTITFKNATTQYDCAGGIIGFGSFYKIIDSFCFGSVSSAAKLNGGLVGREGKKSTSLTENAYYLDSACAYAEENTAVQDLVEAVYTAGMKSANAQEFALSTGVLAAINSEGVFALKNGRYPEFSDLTEFHTHTGGSATCSQLAVCDACGLEYGSFDPSVHLHFEMRNYRNPVWAYDGNTGDTYCSDCGTLITAGQAIPADKDRQALEIDYKHEGELKKIDRYSVSALDALKSVGKVGYTYGAKSTTMMAATEYVTIESLLKAEGLTFDDINSITVYYSGNRDTVSAETLTSCIYYFDEQGNRHDAPAAICFTYTSLDGTLDVVAAGARTTDDLRFGYGVSQAQYDANTSLGGRRLVSPVEKLDINLKEDPEVLDHLEVSAAPQYTAYHAGDTFRAEGMVIMAVSKDGTRKTTTDYEVAEVGELEPEDTFVTVSYGWSTVQVPITVSEHDYDDSTHKCVAKRYDGTVCGQIENVDVSKLAAAITKAKAAMEGVTISAEGTEISSRDSWILPSDAERLQAVIDSANALIESTDLSQKQVNAKVVELGNATAEFNAQIKAGLFVNVSGILIDPSEILLEAGGQTMLHAVVLPENASNQNVSWSSSDTAVARIDQNGNVTAVGPGTVQILLVSEEGAFVAACEVKVIAKTITPTPVTIKKAKQPMKVKTVKKTVKYKTLKKKNVTVSGAIKVSKAKGKVTYTKKSGNKKISINKKTGKITLKKRLKKGTYKIKVQVKAAGNASYKAGTKNVTVTIKVK